jgi:hypothetical protein
MTSGTLGAPVSGMFGAAPAPSGPGGGGGGIAPSAVDVGGGFTDESCCSPASGLPFGGAPGASALELQEDAQSTLARESTRAQQDLTVFRRMEI